MFFLIIYEDSRRRRRRFRLVINVVNHLAHCSIGKKAIDEQGNIIFSSTQTSKGVREKRKMSMCGYLSFSSPLKRHSKIVQEKKKSIDV